MAAQIPWSTYWALGFAPRNDRWHSQHLINPDYDLDDEGDVILTLENSNEPFAVWLDEGELQELPQPPPPLVLDDQGIRSFRLFDPALQESVPEDSGQWDGFQEVEPVQEELSPPPEIPEATLAEGAEVSVDVSNLSLQDTPYISDLSEGTVSEQTGPEDDGVISKEVSQIRFRLSSRHLISASSYFRAMLTGPWKESTSGAHSLYNVSATGWDKDAFKLLMDIFHGNSQNVPRSVDLELLAKIAVLVDYYKCHDALKFYADTWIESLGVGIELRNYSREFVLELFASCVFFLRTPFHDFTCQAIQETRGPLQSLGLPFPEGLIEQIERNREDTVGGLLDGYHHLLQYLTTRNSCHSECNAVLVGSLYREIFARGIFNPRPARPFYGFSVDGAVQMARDIQSPTGVCKGRYYYSDSTCSIGKFLEPFTKKVMGTIKGLELDNFVANPWLN